MFKTAYYLISTSYSVACLPYSVSKSHTSFLFSIIKKKKKKKKNQNNKLWLITVADWQVKVEKEGLSLSQRQATVESPPIKSGAKKSKFPF